MMRNDEPMTTFDEDEWRTYKRLTRTLRHRQRLEQVREPDPAPWLAAVERDNRADPAERELVLEEQVIA